MGLGGRPFASRDLESLFNGDAASQKTDGQLLDRFLVKRDDVAFEVLVSRHASMVFRTLNRVLPRRHDAEDAFQATFLILARKAASVRNRDSLGPWLHGVATRIAVKARASTARRRDDAREYAETRSPPARIEREIERDEVLDVIRDEIDRLPAVYREPLALCYVDGLKCEQIAQRLGRPVGTISVQIARARNRLRDRLARRGVLAPAAMLGLGVVNDASAAVSKTLIASTVKAALPFAVGHPAVMGTVPMPAASLAEGVLRAMFVTKLKLASALVLATLAATGVGLTAWGSSASPRAEAPKVVLGPSVVVADDKPKSDLDKLKGTWQAESFEGVAGKAEGKGSEADLFKLTVDGEKFTFEGIFGMGRGPAKGTLKLYPTKSPKTFDMTTPEGKLIGIYELDGDELKICLNKIGIKDLPTEFTATDSRFVIVFKRDKP
jgi:RNA polymerase sigma factor (sigma-70 family)